MPFSNSKEIAVLESKFQIYEELSKEMLDKLERAVATISENSNRISLILERHEARLDQSDKTDMSILKLIERIETKVQEVEQRVENLIKFRWIIVGITMAAVTILQSSEFFASVLTQNQTNDRIERLNR